MEQLSIRDVPGGSVLAVKAVPGSSRDKVVGVLGDCLKIATSAAAERGKANASLAAILAKALGVDRRSVEVISGGMGGRHKQYRLLIEEELEVHNLSMIPTPDAQHRQPQGFADASLVEELVSD